MKVSKCEICNRNGSVDGFNRCIPCGYMLSNYDLNPDDIERAKELLPITDGDFRRAFMLGVAINWGGFEGEHHKAWALDQVVRLLAGVNYKRVVVWAKDGEDGPDTYSYEEGIAP